MAREDRFLKACRREPADCTPVWLMRQAGRYLPEYRALRNKHGFMEMCKTPELAVEVTLQPVRRFELDAAIIFSDILLPLEPMGIEVAFAEGDGPAIRTPIRTKADVERLRPIAPEEDMPFLMEALRATRSALAGKIPLIGFSGAPFTLASYAIEGGGSKNFVLAKSMMLAEPTVFHRLMEALTDMVVRYLNAQVESGAQALQVFDSWVGALSAQDYASFVLPHMKRLFAQIDHSVPVIHFGVGAFHLVQLLADAGGDVIGVDWRTPLDEAWGIIGETRAIQGNLDPVDLFAPPAAIEARVTDVLSRAAGRPGHIFNLGHGVLPGTPPEAVALVVDTVHDRSRRA
jgi:uroporphyrinogen decarboxylase